MTKLRTPNSVEDALHQAVGLLGEERVAHCIGRSPSLVRQFADPDSDKRLPVEFALCVDRALAHAGHCQVFAELFAHQAEQNRPQTINATAVEVEPPLRAAVRMVAQASSLVEHVHQAEADQVIDRGELTGLLGDLDKLLKIAGIARRSLVARVGHATRRLKASR
jgi:hypothetical protein